MLGWQFQAGRGVWLGSGQVPVFPSWLGRAGGRGGSQPPRICLPPQPAEATVPGGGSGEREAHF